MAEQRIGRVTHYFARQNVAGVELTEGSLAVDESIRIRGHATDFEQVVESMHRDDDPVEFAEKGKLVSIRVVADARVNDTVYKLLPDG